MTALFLSWLIGTAEGAIPDFSVPFSVVAWVGGGILGVVGLLFRMLIAANTERQKEMARVTESLAVEQRRAWAIVDRVTRSRVLEIAAFPHVPPQIREEAKIVCDEITEAQKETQRREKP